MTQATRLAIVETARSLFSRGLTHGSTGNISARSGDLILVTPTGSSLGTVQPEGLSVIDLDGQHVDGPAPSKEAFLHAAMLRARPQAGAVIHTHSTYSAAVSCLIPDDPDDILPPLTAYFVMRIGRLPLLPYHAPGDDTLGAAAEAAARSSAALMLSNHGPIVAANTLGVAMDAIEELEQTARLHLTLRGMNVRHLAPAEVADLNSRYGRP
ncbi:MAG TPA: 3-oxo-tetronate 4-phosphate decarboxylase [Microbacterium sp.]|uniref:3-oxo-tetronate 4-phosphate decarboxylase n=1 Tax=Microbacterium sp. TaxID=51671 RepID=UPI002C1BCCBB|nr:3-oxo-tetronate 4-phosphate decarboxylase [Microbacterium sp.]HWI30031.1 3-oxo-tetronate 4-phosphate decarboxylase [Microbacterium sp.]